MEEPGGTDTDKDKDKASEETATVPRNTHTHTRRNSPHAACIALWVPYQEHASCLGQNVMNLVWKQNEVMNNLLQCSYFKFISSRCTRVLKAGGVNAALKKILNYVNIFIT